MSTEVVALERQASDMVTEINGLAVIDPPSFERAGIMARTVAGYIKRVGEVLDPIVAAAHDAHKIAVAQRDALLKPAQGAKRVLGDRMAAYEAEQARIRRAAELAVQRERERLEAEERARVAVEERRLRQEEEDRRLAEASAAEAIGDTVRAEAIVSAPIVTAPVVPRPVFVAPPPVQVTKAEGVSFREEWDFEVTNAAVIPREYLSVDEVKIRRVVKAMKGQTNIPGVRAFSKPTAAMRA